ncbi:MAG: FIG023677: hypothetical protein [uncultured Thiotrichaceae bacterium]|uniref:UPF0276 protein HELGO_WM24635 n=1 Tax=uncultured Thiotrichaceae bacterium TaxID=298394 RepID=A0A6S6U3X5_9GAMM|nr:MAG: FIG023677: hypothetical protein [uncultured Thiotrichaceae bacterium]
MTSLTSSQTFPVTGAGLGLRRGELMESLEKGIPSSIDFMEVAPENWIPMGKTLRDRFKALSEQVPFVCHGLSLSIGSPAPLDEEFVYAVKDFIKAHDIRIYSEHLSYCSDTGHMYDLLPIPFTEEAVHYTANRIKRVQDILEQRIAMENVSFYAAPSDEMTEIEFVNAVLEEADCHLHIDINNIYVNSVNHQYDAEAFLKALPGERIAYAHIAGHYNEAEDLIVDTHGADVIQPVWDLLDTAYDHFGVFPTLVERDFNIPPLDVLVKEVEQVHDYQNKYQTTKREATGTHG